MAGVWNIVFPPPPTFTEKDVSDQFGKVFIVTGSSGGVGKELAQILYAHNAKVYVAARSQDKADAAIKDIKTNVPESKGELIFLHLDLDDLTTIKKSAEEFLAKEDKLDILWNNAGVMVPPQGSKTKQGYELQLGTNCVAPFLFTKLLTPLLVKTAKTAPSGSVRVVWVSSSAVGFSPKGGVPMDNLDYKKDLSARVKYGISKSGNYLHATEYAKRHKADGVVSVSLNPGNLKSDLIRHAPAWQAALFGLILYTPIHGAYTELFGGLSPEISLENTGAWMQPWGRIQKTRPDLEAASKSVAEGGTGIGQKFWEWSENEVKSYL